MNEEDFALFVRAYNRESMAPTERNKLYQLADMDTMAHSSNSTMARYGGAVERLEAQLTPEQRVYLKLTS